MTDEHYMARLPKELAAWKEHIAGDLAGRVGSPNAANTTRAKTLDYYRSVILGDGPESVAELVARIGQGQYGEVLQELNADARRQAMGRG